MTILARDVRKFPAVPGQGLLVVLAGQVDELRAAGWREGGEMAGGEGEDAVHEEGIGCCDLGDVGLPEGQGGDGVPCVGCVWGVLEFGGRG